MGEWLKIGIKLPFSAFYATIKIIMSVKSLSIHPKLAGVIDLFFGAVFLFSIKHVFALWFLAALVLARIFAWMVLARLSYYPAALKRFWHLLSLLVFHLGATLLLLFIEWGISWTLVAAVYLVFPFISFWLLPSKDQNFLSFVQKPYRRWRFWMILFGLYGVWTGIFASISLQILNLNHWWLLILGAVFSAAISLWWWREYGIEMKGKFWWWVLAIAIFLVEIAWVLYLWPLGYFVSAFMIVWLWYDIWLMARFHLLPAGINWKKQISFFIGNGLLLLIFLILIVKWK